MKLGKNQMGFLKCTLDRAYYPGCGWVWGNTSTSLRLAEGLVKRGLMRKTNHQGTRCCWTAYSPTDAGRMALGEHLNEEHRLTIERAEARQRELREQDERMRLLMPGIFKAVVTAIVAGHAPGAGLMPAIQRNVEEQGDIATVPEICDVLKMSLVEVARRLNI